MSGVYFHIKGGGGCMEIYNSLHLDAAAISQANVRGVLPYLWRGGDAWRCTYNSLHLNAAAISQTGVNFHIFGGGGGCMEMYI